MQLISPFVGRIYDWYKAANKRDYTGAEDPGVQSVQEIYTYYKKFGYKTEVMGASFRNVGQILELAGCDLLTISPELMKELSESHGRWSGNLTPEKAKDADMKRSNSTKRNSAISSTKTQWRRRKPRKAFANSRPILQTGEVRCEQTGLTNDSGGQRL